MNTQFVIVMFSDFLDKNGISSNVLIFEDYR